jgi:hypothetical protein
LRHYNYGSGENRRPVTAAEPRPKSKVTPTPGTLSCRIHDLAALGVSAQSLHFLNYLIADPIRVPFLYRSGVLVQIPRPERYAVHKLIVADRRQGGPDALKAHKDRAQAAFLIEALAETRPQDIAEAYNLACETGPEWRKRIAASLERMPTIASLLKELT